MNNSRSPVFGTISVPSTSGGYFPPATATVWNQAPVMYDNQSEPAGTSSLPASNSVQLHPISNSSTKICDFSTTATVVSSAMNTSTPLSSAKSVPSTPSVSRETGGPNINATPARSNIFGSSSSTTIFNHLKSSSVKVAAAGNPAAQSLGSLFANVCFYLAHIEFTLASHKPFDAPPQKRAKTTHNIAAQLSANEFTNRLDLFRGPEVLVAAGTSLVVKSYRIPRALLIQASPYFETGIKVETIGQISQEMLKMDCSTLAFDFVVQFLYTGTFVCPNFMAGSGSEQITTLVDFHELAEKLSLDISDRILDNIKQLLVDDHRNLLAKHIRKAINYPTGHGLRMLFARSCIHAYLESVNPSNEQARTFVFKKELEELDGFAADLMRVYGEVAEKRVPAKYAESRDLLDGETFYY
ncbi:predicted protein [Sclerotinia sclerotiorum 1980 UF-70]|uniref:BTB domain-containing protein n=2 Tax=Sclerotinia sclerotiorum (strain ATCC 18683 / 1980 / Ss-1) TaxID=665079 RepID=A7EG38_SCLS1|nr:predicted protein [Sclerotinia sclerotiorum 1980 UF-70]APA07033.1 hypothetical protein sscle_02g018030 [Sclerotinia sclerotiorum 1980 UF-70]EDO01804.1 predicted protein [Sclerotinia sclerotiorum 1980 UF-70]